MGGTARLTRCRSRWIEPRSRDPPRGHGRLSGKVLGQDAPDHGPLPVAAEGGGMCTESFVECSKSTRS